MKIWAISDLHMSTACNKPMDVFGGHWENYLPKIFEEWQRVVAPEDIVLLAGDHSWGMRMEEAEPDIAILAQQKGLKVLLKGNHDYWWKSISAVRNMLPEGMYAVQNDAMRFGNVLVCGTRGWTVPESNKVLDDENQRIYLREIERLKLSLKAMETMRKPDDYVICMMHFPPFNSMREDSPFTLLLEQYKVHAVVYGHLHGKLSKRDLVYTKNNIPYYLTSCDQVENHLVRIF